MSVDAVGGPALFLGADTPCVALVRPELDPADAGVRLAAQEAGVTPEEFAGTSDVWQVMADRTDGEGRSFELPELTDREAADFADELLIYLATDREWEAELADGALVVTGHTAGDDRVALAARVVPPAGDAGEASPEDETGPLEVELGTLPVSELRTEIAAFRRSLA
ncbi:hypothetical protein [Streptomyces sp. NPDC090445]|uniref:hypothetical protein n=1 Tax=Streptomyces sp. NPDC090445 TaxID=3365963 RepID=UPI0037FFF509